MSERAPDGNKPERFAAVSSSNTGSTQGQREGSQAQNAAHLTISKVLHNASKTKRVSVRRKGRMNDVGICLSITPRTNQGKG